MLLSKTLPSYRKYVHLCSLRAAMNQNSPLLKSLNLSGRHWRQTLRSFRRVQPIEDRANGFIALKRKPFHSIVVAKAELLFNSINAAGDEAMKMLKPLARTLAKLSIDATVFLFIYQ